MFKRGLLEYPDGNLLYIEKKIQGPKTSLSYISRTKYDINFFKRKFTCLANACYKIILRFDHIIIYLGIEFTEAKN